MFNPFKKRQAEEQTMPQIPTAKGSGRVVVGSSTGGNSGNEFFPTPPANIATWREMRLDPTLALARAIANAPVRTANVSVVSTGGDVPDEYVEMVDEFVKTHWSKLITSALFARDYGFQPFELVYAVRDGMVVVADIKALLPDITQVVLDMHGDYVGLVNGAAHTESSDLKTLRKKNGVVVLPPEKTLWIVNGREGDNYYGESAMERARKAWDEYNKIRKKAQSYSTSIAGPIPFVTYPDTEVEDENGQKRPAFEMAATLIRSLQNAQGVAVPSYNAQWVGRQLENLTAKQMPQAWDIGFFETANHGSEFLEFEKAREVEKFRAWLVPERAGMEGQFGTKAEAETHGSLVLTIADLFLGEIVSTVNSMVVDTMLGYNFGPDAPGTVQIVVESKDPAQVRFLQEIVKGLFGAPLNIDMFEDLANLRTTFELLGIPLNEDDDDGVIAVEPVEEEQEPAVEPEEEPEEEPGEELAVEGERYMDEDGAIYEYRNGRYDLIMDASGE